MIAGLVIGGVGAFAIVGALFALAWWGRDAEQRCADYRVADMSKAGQLAISAKEIADLKERAERAERQADALDKELDQVAQDGDVAGARERVLARYRRQAGLDPVPTADGDQGAVLAGSGGERDAVKVVDRDGLERPGD